MGRPPINGTRAMTATERQQRWRLRCREQRQPSRPDRSAKPEPQPEAHAAGAPDEYTPIINQVLEFVDAQPGSQLHLFRLIMRLQSAYQRRQEAAVERSVSESAPCQYLAQCPDTGSAPKQPRD
jgi:hypothetical protein